tara:strand:+ start:153 stop:1418 length:1266 start_codon:yes stop_codon:yes gene_type:complete
MLEVPAIILSCVAIFGYVNYRYLKLPLTVGLVLIALISSVLVIFIDGFAPEIGILNYLRRWLENIDFNRALMQGMLSFLLFAGALHVNLEDLIKSKLQVTILASLGVVISTLINGIGFYWLTKLFEINIDFLVCLIFGVIVSPTDPVAVLAMLKRIKVPIRLKATIAGESLFNDGVAIVLYSMLVAIAFGEVAGNIETEVGVNAIVGFFVREAFGGALLGLIAGYGAFLLLRKMDDYVIEVITTLALVTGAYSLALHLHVSGPIAMVIAGVFIGNTGRKLAMSELTRMHVTEFWHLVDEILNAALFVLIGFEVIMLSHEGEIIVLSVFAILVSLFARWSAVFIPMTSLSSLIKKDKGDVIILTWAGLRGGISVALALALPSITEKSIILTATYAVVVFTILIQGLTIKPLIIKIHGSKNEL